MGELIVMPSRNTEATEPREEQTLMPVENGASSIDFSVWKGAPRERTLAYFPTYSAVSKAIQTAMRAWVQEWFAANPEIMLRPHTAYPILVFQCTHPFSGKPTNMFTYDIQQTEAVDRAFASAGFRLGRYLKTLDTKRFAWFTREHYFAYRSKQVVKHVMKNRRAIYKMLNVETMLMNAILKFAIIDLPAMRLDDAVAILRRTFYTQLCRFSDEFDMSGRVEELLRVATDALVAKLAADKVLPLPLAA